MPRGTTSQIRRRSRRAAARTGPATAPADRAALRASLIASGDAAPALVTNYDLSHGSPAERFFHEAALEAGFEELDSDWWPSEASLGLRPETVFRVNEGEQVLRLPDGTLAHVRGGYGGVSVTTAGPGGQDAISMLRAAYPASYLTIAEDARIPITFWMMGSFGPTQRLRRVEAQPWGDVEANYPASVKAELERVMGWSGGEDASGQLLLWQGLPGTGKTWALRALADAWSSWAEFHYITDPDVFFGQRSSYMLDVLLSDSYMAIDGATGDVYDEEGAGGKWKVLILEDTGDLLASNARDSYSAGLSRLLNVVDGMIGQGLRVLALVTTNDQIDDFHPAVTRPGRCAQQLSFGPLSPDEATAWLGDGTQVSEPMTVAELYAAVGASRDAELAMAPCAACGHAFTDHMGSSGPCTFAGCSCDGYDGGGGDTDGDGAALEAGGRKPIMEAFVRIRPDLSEFESEFSREVERVVSETLTSRSEALEDAVLERLTEGMPEEVTETMRLRLQDLRVVDGELAAADAADAVDLPDAHRPGAKMPKKRAAVAPAQPSATIPLQPDEGNGPANASVVRWQAILCPEGEPTDDGRIFAPGSIEWRELPLTLMAMIETAPGHDGAQVAGRIDRVWKDGSKVMGEGVFDAGDFGQEIGRMVGDGTLRGVSIDIAILAMEVTYRSSVLDADGTWIAKPADVEETDDPDGLETPDVIGHDDELMLVVWRGKIGAATVCPFPAFEAASIELAELTAGGPPNPLHWRYKHQAGFVVTQRPPTVAEMALIAASGTGRPMTAIDVPPGEIADLTAGADDVPDAPPAEWFDDPRLERLTGLTVTEDGRVYGHAAPWDTCHIGIPGICTSAPQSRTAYAYFHLKEIEVDDGSRVACGTITLDTGHAGKGLGRVAATRHYDHTGTAVAQVRVGEDEHGIWVAGAVMAGVGDDEMRMLRGAVLSGDWRNVDGNLELVALLCVNVPGFPVPRGPEAALVASGGRMVVESLVAAGLGHGGVSDADRERLRALLAAADGTMDGLLAEDPAGSDAPLEAAVAPE